MLHQHAQSVKGQVNGAHHYCLYCQAHLDKCGFDKHQRACKIIWQQRQQNTRPARQLKKQTQAEKVINSPVGYEVRARSVSMHLDCFLTDDKGRFGSQ